MDGMTLWFLFNTHADWRRCWKLKETLKFILIFSMEDTNRIPLTVSSGSKNLRENGTVQSESPDKNGNRETAFSQLRFPIRIIMRFSASSSEKTEKIEEKIDEIEIEGQRPDHGKFPVRFR